MCLESWDDSSPSSYPRERESSRSPSPSFSHISEKPSEVSVPIVGSLLAISFTLLNLSIALLIRVPFQWYPDAIDPFQTMKYALTSPPILTFPNLSAPFRLYNDVSLHAIRSVLSQKVAGRNTILHTRALG